MSVSAFQVGYRVQGDSYTTELVLAFRALRPPHDALLGKAIAEVRQAFLPNVVVLLRSELGGYELRPRLAGGMSRDGLLDAFFQLARHFPQWRLEHFA